MKVQIKRILVDQDFLNKYHEIPLIEKDFFGMKEIHITTEKVVMKGDSDQNYEIDLHEWNIKSMKIGAEKNR